MPHPRYQPGEIARLGAEIYDRDIRESIEADYHGDFLALDVETGEYEIDPEPRAAIDRAKSKRDQPPLYLTRIGYPAAFRVGGTFKVNS